MKKSVGVRWGNLKTGLLLVAAIAVAMWASLSGAGTSIFQSKGHFVCYFKNVNGLVYGSPVWLSGVEVGNVREVTFVNLDPERQVKVVCRVRRSIWNMLTTDSEVQLGTIGILGDKYVEVIPGTHGLPTINDMDVIRTRDAGDAMAMFKAGENAMNEAGSVVRNLDTLLVRMNRGQGTLGRLANDQELYAQITQLVANLARLTADLQKNQERLIASIEKTSNAFSDVSGQVSKKTGTLGRVVDDPSLYNNLAATSARLDTIMSKINAAQGSLGLFVNDTAMYSEVRNLIVRVNNLVTDIEKNPRKYFKFSVF